MWTAYKCRLYPTFEQASILNRTFGCIRVVWNVVLKQRSELYNSEKISTSYKEASVNLTLLKQVSEFSYLREVAAVPLQQAIRYQQKAFINFFAKRASYPRFKTRNGRQSATYASKSFMLRNGNLRLAKIKDPISFVWSFDTDVTTVVPAYITISRDPDGRWFVSFAVDTEIPQLLQYGEVVGVDLGLKYFAVLSTGERIEHPKYMEAKERKLKRYQRILARTQKGSNNRRKAKQRVARQHSKVRDERKVFLHGVSTYIVRRFQSIAIEDLNVTGMLKNRKLSKAISRTGWGEFRQLLTYKAERYSRNVVVVDRWFPSSKLCSVCGFKLSTLSLAVRKWTCEKCSTLHDRDVNAAKNLVVAAGLVETLNACPGRDWSYISSFSREDVRRGMNNLSQSSMKQELQLVKAGIS